MRNARSIAVAVLSVAVAGVALVMIFQAPSGRHGSSNPSVSDRHHAAASAMAITGRVLSVNGRAVPGAVVTSGDARALTDADGRFHIPLPRTEAPVARWVLVQHDGYLARAKAALPNRDTAIALTPDDGHTIAVTFAGDVMFGRRFFDPNEDGSTRDALLSPNASAARHAALFRFVQPLLSTADLSVVNLETPLISRPYLDPAAPRRTGLHPTKEFVIASSVSAAAGLKQAGIDVVGIGNNHLYDALDAGVTSTIRALEGAGFKRGVNLFGGGINSAQAMRPAVVQTAAGPIAFVGCTTIEEPTEDGVVHHGQISYVAGATKGGAALCRPKAISREVRRLHRHNYFVVVQFHGGYEYVRTPSPSVRELTRAALDAGANLIVNHHPHVVGSIRKVGSSLVAWTMGNFVFDQTVWPTFQSYALTVVIRDGELIRAYIDPLLIEDYVPHGVAGGAADLVARQAANAGSGAATLTDGAAEVSVSPQLTAPRATGSALLRRTGLYRLADGVTASTASRSLDFGEDLLWMGSFEDQDTDASWGEGSLWDVSSADVAVEQDAALTGLFGVHLHRSPTNCSDVFLTTIHRILVEPGSKLSVVGATRARGGGDLRLQLSWYADTEGPSGQQTLVDIPDREPWKHFIVDATVPDYAVAVGLYLRLSPSTAADTSADVDDLALIAWHAGAPSAVDQYMRALDAPTRLTFSQGIPPGSHARPPSSPTYIRAGITTAPSPRPTASTRARC